METYVYISLQPEKADPRVQDHEVKTTLQLIADSVAASTTDDILPPLRNPPVLETTEDLTNLSYLNEPAGTRLAPLRTCTC